jgi:hypothetical protein
LRWYDRKGNGQGNSEKKIPTSLARNNEEQYVIPIVWPLKLPVDAGMDFHPFDYMTDSSMNIPKKNRYMEKYLFLPICMHATKASQ